MQDVTLERAPESGREDQTRIERETHDLARKLAEVGRSLKQALAEKERLSRTLTAVIETLEAGVILVDGRDRPLAHNAAAQRMGLVGQEGGRCTLVGALSAAGPCNGTLRPEGASGPTWLVRRSSIRDDCIGTCHVLLVQDVSETLALEEAAHRKSRLEGLGRMLAEVGHQIRNPLGGLELFAAMLIDDLEDRPAQLEIAQEMLAGVRQLSATVTNLLARVRDRRARRELTEIEPLLTECLEAIRPIALSRGVHLEAPGIDVGAPVAVDPEGLRQVALNLLDNAIEAAGRDGHVLLEARVTKRALSLVVSDSGPGVAEGSREDLFEPFYTTRADGTGLGLSVVERIASAHGGSARVGDSPLGGARFEVLLGLDDPETEAPRQALRRPATEPR